MSEKQYYRIAEKKYSEGHVFRGSGKRPLQDRFPEVEAVLDKCRPKGKIDRGQSVYLREGKNFQRVGVTFDHGYVHRVRPSLPIDRRDLVWTGILQFRYIKDERFRKNLRSDLTDDEVAEKWWAGEESEKPDWEWVTAEAIVVHVEDDAQSVRPDSSFWNFFDKK